MIRKILYLALIGFSLAFAALSIITTELGFDFDISRYMPQVIRPDAIPPAALPLVAWVCLALTALFYLLGLVKIYWAAKSDPWRAILFTISIILTGIGLLFFRLQTIGLIDRSTFFLIAVMVAPFLPAVLYLPFATTYSDHLAGAEK